MKKYRQIGFNASDEEVSEEPTNTDTTIILLRKHIESNYSPIGTTEEKDLKSSMEIQYELSESMDVSMREINQVLTDLDFKVQFLGGFPHWVMYRINP